MKKLCCVLALVVATTAGAQASPRVTLNVAVNLITRAQNSLLIYAPTMQNPEVTTAYRQVATRDVTTVIITTPEAVQQGSRNERVVQVAFAGWDTKTTQLYAPKVTNAANSVPFVVIDETFALVGRNLTQIPLPGDSVQVDLVRDPKIVASLVKWVGANAQANPQVDLLKWFSNRLKRP